MKRDETERRTFGRKVAGVLNTTLNVAVLLVAAYVVFRPGGLLSQYLSERRSASETRELIDSEWASLTEVGGRLDPGDGSVLLIEFSDYQCPFCREAHGEIDALLRETPEIGVVYRHFPLAVHPAAEGAARAAICAEAQGRFREMNARLFETDQWQVDTTWVREAAAAGVADLERFSDCLHATSTTERLELDKAIGGRLGVSGTPTFVTREQLSSGVLPRDELHAFLGISPPR